MTKQEQIMEFESHLMIGLFKATVEQTTQCTNKYNFKLRADFNLWQKQGFKILEELEKRNITDVQYLDKIGDIYHTINSNMREEFYKGLE
jgi:hypothetical protein